jgi:hypothetical protein
MSIPSMVLFLEPQGRNRNAVIVMEGSRCRRRWQLQFRQSGIAAMPRVAKLEVREVRRSQRLPELDALRGLMLVLMMLAHLPTQAQVITN